MPNEVILGIRIQADGSIAVKQIGDVGKSVASLGEGSRSTFDQLKSHWLAASAVIYGSLRTIQAGWALAQNAAGVQEQMASLDALSARYGTTADQITDRISQVSGGLIGHAAAAEVATQSLSKNLSPDQIYRLADAAETLSNVTGKTAADSFRELSAAVALGRERAMEGSAGAIDLRDRYGELASMMTEAERRQALYNLVLEKSNQLKREGVGLSDSDADKLERYGNVVAEVKRQVGNFLLQGVIPLAHGMTWGIQVAQQHEAAIKAAALAAGVFAAGHFLAGSAAVAKLAFGIQNAGFVLQYFATTTLGPMLLNPITWIVAAIGGLAYLWVKLGQGTQEARIALDQYRASAGALNAEQRAQELSRQKAYIDELTAYIQRQQEVLAKGPTWNPFDDAVNASYLDKAQRSMTDAQERVKALSVHTPAFKPPADTGYSERLKRLEDLEREYLNKKEMATTAELDQELVQLNNWYDEQGRVLDKLNADQRHYKALDAAYSAAYDKAAYDRASKFADAALELHRKSQKDRLDLSVARGQAELNLEEQAQAEGQKLNELAMRSWNATESDAIRTRAAAERASLESQQKRLNLKELEQVIDGEFAGTLAEYTALLAERALLQERIESSKRVEVDELDRRRLAIEREVLEITRQQRDMAAEMQVRNVTDALSRAGGDNIAGDVGTIVGIQAGVDPYRQDFDRWSVIQDEKIMRLQELGATEASLKDEYRQYDLMQEQMVQQQKLAAINGYAAIAAGLMESANAAAQGKNRSMFEAMKATQIASALISTYSGAAAALAPPPLGLGPIFGIPLAALVVASGLMRVASISQQKFGGGSASGGGGISMPSGGGMALPEAAPAPQAAKASPTVNIHIYGNVVDHDKFARELVPAITKAIGDGVQ